MPLPPLPTPTPHTSHNPSHTYPPSEDTHHLLDVLSSPSQRAFLAARFPLSSPSPIILELGVGSGVILALLTAHARTIFGREDVLTLGTDMNAFACATAKGTVEESCAKAALDVDEDGDVDEDVQRKGRGRPGAFLDVLTADLASPLRNGTVDMLVFNPPYVPSETLPLLPTAPTTEPGRPPSTTAKPSTHHHHDTFTEHNQLLALATDGGAPDGMEVTRRLLGQLPTILSERGVAYVLLCARNRPRDVVESVKAWKGEGEGGGKWEASVVGESGGMAGWERLCVVRVERVLEEGRP